MHAGDLFIIAARPSMGKTALAMNIAHHVATKVKGTVAVFSLEMSKESLLTRMLFAASRVDSQKFRAGFLGAKERQELQKAAHQLVEAPLYIDDTAGVSKTATRRSARFRGASSCWRTIWACPSFCSRGSAARRKRARAIIDRN